MIDRLVKSKFGCPLNRAAVAADWRARYSCDLFVDPPGREWNNFVHARNELVTVAKGRLEVRVAGSRFVAEPGDEVFIPKGALHSVKNVHVTYPAGSTATIDQWPEHRAKPQPRVAETDSSGRRP